jgi:hypothetical protein
MSEPLTHSDLIYLFVDGEASPAERSKLYEALANNPELQAEFEDAMRMKEAVEREVIAAVPPPSLTEALFLRAGVAVPVAVSSAVAPAVPALTNIANSGWFALVKTFALPALAVTGAMTYGVIKLTENNPLPAQAPQAISRTIEDHRSLPQMITTISPETPAMAEAELVKKSSASNAVRKSGVSVINENTPAVKMASEPPVTHEKIVANNSNAATTTSTTSSPVAVAVEPKEEASFASIPSAAINDLSSNSISNIGGEGEKLSFNPLSKIESADKTLASIGFERYAGESFFQDRNGKIPTTGFALNNTAVNVLFTVSNNFAIGAQVSDESFPFFKLHSDGAFSAEPSLTSFGVKAQYTPVKLGDVNLVTSGFIGGSNVGPVTKAKLGLEYLSLFGGPVNVSAGYEWTELYYSSHNATIGAGKTAFTFGLNYTF